MRKLGTRKQKILPNFFFVNNAAMFVKGRERTTKPEKRSFIGGFDISSTYVSV